MASGAAGRRGRGGGGRGSSVLSDLGPAPAPPSSSSPETPPPSLPSSARKPANPLHLLLTPPLLRNTTRRAPSKPRAARLAPPVHGCTRAGAGARWSGILPRTDKLLRRRVSHVRGDGRRSTLSGVLVCFFAPCRPKRGGGGRKEPGLLWRRRVQSTTVSMRFARHGWSSVLCFFHLLLRRLLSFPSFSV